MPDVFKYQSNEDGTYNVIVENVTVPLKNLEDLQHGLGTEVSFEFTDPNQISHKQRRLIFALLNDIEEYTGDPVEFRRHILTQGFMGYKNIEQFSLSDCSMNDARNFIEFILAFVFKFNIPINFKTSDLMKEDKAFLYFATIHRKCVICGQDGADLAHHYHIGRGMNRNTMDHYGYEVLALCRKHHSQQHNTGVESFDNLYKLHNSWLKVDDRLNAMLQGKKYKEG